MMQRVATKANTNNLNKLRYKELREIEEAEKVKLKTAIKVLLNRAVDRIEPKFMHFRDIERWLCEEVPFKHFEGPKGRRGTVMYIPFFETDLYKKTNLLSKTASTSATHPKDKYFNKVVGRIVCLRKMRIFVLREARKLVKCPSQ